jgi:acetyl esterase/lipase
MTVGSCRLVVAPVVLAIHGGGFVEGEPDRDTADWFRSRGVRAIAVEYSKDRPSRGLRDVKRLMRRHVREGRPVYAIGNSAGGTLALKLAQTGQPAAVAVINPVVDLVAWRYPNPVWQRALSARERRIVTPFRRCGRDTSRTYLTHGTLDLVAPIEASRRYAADERCNTRFVAQPGGTHLGIFVHDARGWLFRHILRRRA